VQRPLLVELTDADHARALLAPVARIAVKANAADVAISPRTADGFLYLIAIRKSPTTTGRVRFSGLPAGITQGTVLAHPEGTRRDRWRSRAAISAVSSSASHRSI
jgi:hypothetical protein